MLKATKFSSKYSVVKTLSYEDGVLKKTAPKNLNLQSFQTISFTTIKDLLEIIKNLTKFDCLCWGVCNKQDEGIIITKEQEKRGINGIARTKDNFSWPAGPAVFPVDIDAVSNEPDQIYNTLINILPPLSCVDCLLLSSASSNVILNEEYLSKNKGFRLLFLVPDGTQIPLIGHTLYALSWLKGCGYIVKTGGDKTKLLERSIIDKSIYTPQFLDFLGPSILKGNLQQRKDYKIYKGSGKPFSIKHYLVTVEKQKSIELAIFQEKKKFNPNLVFREKKYTLPLEHKIILESGENITAADILKDKDKYHGTYCADPYEPDYQTDRRISQIYTKQATPVIHSFAHGGRNFYLSPRPIFENYYKKEGAGDLGETPPWFKVSNRGSVSFISDPAADFILSKMCCKSYNEMIYIYNEESGLYSPKTFLDFTYDIKKILKPLSLPEHITPYQYSSVVRQIYASTCNPKERPDQEMPEFLPISNGVLNLETLELEPYTSDLFITKKAPVEYNSKAKCPTWLNFLNSLGFDESTLARLQEWYGYCLTTETTLQKALYLLGSGANGKSVFLHPLTKMLGPLVSTLDPATMTDRFQLVGLVGRRVNVCTDVDTTRSVNEQIKKIIAGERLTTDVKHHNPIDFVPYAKQIFSSNNIIISKDRTTAFYRRFDVLIFKKQFLGPNRDLLLFKKLEKELNGILNWALEGLKRLKENSWEMTPSVDFEEGQKVFFEETNPLVTFLEENTEPSLDSYILRNKLYQQYVSWCHNNGFKPRNKIHFSRDLYSFPHITGKRIRINGKKEYVYVGIKEI